MTTYLENFEGGLNGVTAVPGTNVSWDSTTIGAGATITFDNTKSVAGTRSIKFTTPATATTATGAWSTSVSWAVPCCVSGCFYFTTRPPNQHRLLTFTKSGLVMVSIYMTTTGQLELWNSVPAKVGNLTTIPALNNWFRVEMKLITASATIGQAELRYYDDPYDTVPTEVYTSPATVNTLTGPPTETRHGPSLAVSNASFWADYIQVTNNGTYPLPPPLLADIDGIGDLTLTASATTSGLKFARTANAQLALTGVASWSPSVIDVNAGITLTGNANVVLKYATTATSGGYQSGYTSGYVSSATGLTLVASATDALKYPVSAPAAITLAAATTNTLSFPRPGTAFLVLTALSTYDFNVAVIADGELELTALAQPTILTPVTGNATISLLAIASPFQPVTYYGGDVYILKGAWKAWIEMESLNYWLSQGWKIGYPDIDAKRMPTYMQGRWAKNDAEGYNSSNAINDEMWWAVNLVPGYWYLNVSGTTGPDRGTVFYDMSIDNGVTWTNLSNLNFYATTPGTLLSGITAPSLVPGNTITRTYVRMRTPSKATESTGYYMTNRGISFTYSASPPARLFPSPDLYPALTLYPQA